MEGHGRARKGREGHGRARMIRVVYTHLASASASSRHTPVAFGVSIQSKPALTCLTVRERCSACTSTPSKSAAACSAGNEACVTCVVPSLPLMPSPLDSNWIAPRCKHAAVARKSSRASVVATSAASKLASST